MLFGTYYRITVFKPRPARHRRRCILITSDIHRPLWLVSVHEELKWLSGGTLRQAGLLSRATASNSCRKNIRLSKLPPDSTLYRKVAKREERVFFLLLNSKSFKKQILNPCFDDGSIIFAGTLITFKTLWNMTVIMLLIFELVMYCHDAFL